MATSHQLHLHFPLPTEEQERRPRTQADDGLISLISNVFVLPPTQSHNHKQRNKRRPSFILLSIGGGDHFHHYHLLLWISNNIIFFTSWPRQLPLPAYFPLTVAFFVLANCSFKKTRWPCEKVGRLSSKSLSRINKRLLPNWICYCLWPKKQKI